MDENETRNDPASRAGQPVDELIARACDDLLSEEDVQQLAEVLRRDPAQRASYLEAMGVESLLAAEHEAHPVTELLANDDATTFLTSVLSARAKPRPWVADVLRPERPVVLGALVALAASLLVCTVAVRLWEDSIDMRVATVVAAPKAIVGQPVGHVQNVAAVRWATPVDAAAPVVGGQRLRLLEGVARLHLDGGVDMTLEGPTEIEIVSAMQVRATSGTMRAVADTSAEGFVIETPSAQVVQVGPDRSADGRLTSGVNLQVGDDGVTDVAVYDGQVTLQYARERAVRRTGAPLSDVSFRVSRTVRRVGAGESLRIERSGVLQRLSDRHSGGDGANPMDGCVIRSVSDNLRDPGGKPFYRIVPGGMREDAQAFVDRLHQWNSLEGASIPDGLHGADYVQTFNADKWAGDLAIRVELDGPATLYLLIDERVSTPAWLASRFEDTHAKLGLDEGWSDVSGQRHGLTRAGRLVPIAAGADDSRDPDANGVGPGASIDATYAVWRLDVETACSVTLGSPGVANERTSMYGIAAVRR